jgi:hypothetical protein
MRMLSPAFVATSVVIALGGTAFAQTSARPAGGVMSGGSNAATPRATPNSVPAPASASANGLAPGVSGGVNPALGDAATSDSASDVDPAKAPANPVDANAQTTATVDTAAASKNLDRAIKSEEKDRAKLGRNGQMLESVAPRTNVDRTNQMANDAPSPLFTGSSSAPATPR